MLQVLASKKISNKVSVKRSVPQSFSVILRRKTIFSIFLETSDLKKINVKILLIVVQILFYALKECTSKKSLSTLLPPSTLKN